MILHGALADALSPPRQRWDDEAGAGIGTAFPDDEMGCEVTGCPFTAEGGGVGTDLIKEVSEIVAFLKCVSAHHPIVTSASSERRMVVKLCRSASISDSELG